MLNNDDDLLQRAQQHLDHQRRNEKKSSDEISSLKKIINQAVKKIKETQPLKVDEISIAWRKINEPVINDCTENVKYKNGFIHVTISNLVVKNEIENFRADELLTKLQAELPQYILRGIKVKTGK